MTFFGSLKNALQWVARGEGDDDAQQSDGLSSGSAHGPSGLEPALGGDIAFDAAVSAEARLAVIFQAVGRQPDGPDKW
jgi:hypothetical protein